MYIFLYFQPNHRDELTFPAHSLVAPVFLVSLQSLDLLLDVLFHSEVTWLCPKFPAAVLVVSTLHGRLCFPHIFQRSQKI